MLRRKHKACGRRGGKERFARKRLKRGAVAGEALAQGAALLLAGVDGLAGR